MKKISNTDLLERIQEHGLALDSGELIKCCGYFSIDSDGYEIPLVEEFYQAHIKAIQNSRNFGKVSHFLLSEGEMLFIPKFYAHGYECLSKNCSVYYHLENYRDAKNESGIQYNDKKLKSR